jgi:predicted CoA-substrate-specific enzyme activase
MHSRFIGIDVGAETIKLLELLQEHDGLKVARREIIGHGKKPGPVLVEALRRWDWERVDGAAVTGRFAGQFRLSRIPTKQAQLRGYRFFFGEEAATIVDIGSHGFSVLELRASGLAVFRQNSPCSRGTGNFLCQLVERFSLTVEEASALCADVAAPARLSGRCPVILKTDMTHMANKGEDRARILAGLFDAVCENVLVLIRPGVTPGRVLLTGGVSRSARVRRVFGESLARQGMSLLTLDGEDSLFLEAIGAALVAAEGRTKVPLLDILLLPPPESKLEHLPPLRDALARVRRMHQRPWAELNGKPRSVVIGFDIGSTGSKLVAMDSVTHETVWEGYRQTLGDPVGAAQDLLRRFMEGPAATCSVVAFGVTGSGREVTGSLLTSCFSKESVLIVNEIVAHATGALHYEPRVDTIFEIGGQDAKYIRLADGRVIDCAMNEACSAGTGSFIEEQGRKFSAFEDVQQLGQAAVAAPSGVSLGQHCSVFMAEVIDEAVAAGVQEPAIISGLYDSIIRNYLNRVKGNRSVGNVIFCQGMPFSADALAAAVARHTGSEVIVPPNPGTVGALGIALLAASELGAASLAPLDARRYLDARVDQKDTFVCRSNSGCGGVGDRCRIDRLRTVVSTRRSCFTWGGGCSLHDKGTRRRKLPDLAPDPFREREEVLQKLVAPFRISRGKPRIALSEEFMLKGLFAFFAAFFYEAGYDLDLVADAGPATLKRGIQSATVPFCAPMQHFHGLAESMAETGADWIFVPMLRSLPRVRGQLCSVVCPLVQAGPDLLRWTVAGGNGHRKNGGTQRRTGEDRRRTLRILSPRIDFGEENLRSREFLADCRRMAKTLGLSGSQCRRAWSAGVAAQQEFDDACQRIGRRAMEFCHSEQIVPVIVLGRSYTIYNKVLNSNVPAILREQGAIGIPVDCYPVQADVPLFPDMYWGFGQNILRAAHQVRRTPGVYTLYCSNYSCGPDSFNLHFVAYVMEGKPFAVIETDGHSGDAGTKTRVEAFLHCVEEDRRATIAGTTVNDFESAQFSGLALGDLRLRSGAQERLLIPYLGPGSEAVATVFRGMGLNAESLPAPDEESLRRGRRYTSGKECLPMPLTLGSLLQRLERASDGERFAYLMTSTDGPCRYGVYNLLNNIVLERLGWRNRIRIWSPKDSGYFDDMPGGTEMLVYAGIIASELLRQAKLDVRPVERVRDGAERLFERYYRDLLARLDTAARGDLSRRTGLWEVYAGGLFGIRNILRSAAEEFAALRGPGKLPLVELTGEIYVRAVEFSNDSLIEKLEARGLRVHLAPTAEWITYCGFMRQRQNGRYRLADRFRGFVRQRIYDTAFAAMSRDLGWQLPPSPAESLKAAHPYVNDALEGEAVLTVGAPLHEWRRGEIDAIVSVGPLECMPTKIAEAQFHHVAEHEGLLSLTLAFNGDPVSAATLDNFAYEVNARFQQR